MLAEADLVVDNDLPGRELDCATRSTRRGDRKLAAGRAQVHQGDL